MDLEAERRRIELGLPTAIRAAALDAGVHVTVLPGGAGRYPPEVESAVYFRCAEALRNAAEYGADSVAIALEPGEGGALGFEIREDGAGTTVSGIAGPVAPGSASPSPGSSPSRA